MHEVNEAHMNAIAVQDATQVAPPVAVGSMVIMGIPLQEIVLWATLIYTVLMIIKNIRPTYIAMRTNIRDVITYFKEK